VHIKSPQKLANTLLSNDKRMPNTKTPHLLPKSRSAKKWFKKCPFWYIFAQNARIFDKKVQKSAKKHSFLPSFFA
jgi:hypothetical protein